MEELIAAIDAALRKKGLSDAAASKLAVGHPAFLKNLRANRKKTEKLSTLDSLQRLCEVLGLEFYVGPPKIPINGFEEAAEPVDFSQAVIPDKLEEKLFLPLPRIAQQRSRIELAKLAFSASWFSDLGVLPDNLRTAIVEDAGMAPDIPNGATIVIDERWLPTSKTLAVYSGGKLMVRKSHEAEPGTMVLSPMNSNFQPIIFKRGNENAPAIIGRVLWTSSNWRN